MKAAAFDYIRAASVDEACAALAADPDARIIAGGQTLVPMMAMRLARPSKIVDISRIPDLVGIEERGEELQIGAATRQRAVELSSTVAKRLPLLAEAIQHVGHLPTRHRGTVGGSIVNADPSAEIPLVATILDATFHFIGPYGVEQMTPDEFFIGPMLTSLPEGACLTRVDFPIWDAPRLGIGFEEISARKSDYAYVAAGAQVALAEDGSIDRVALGLGGVEDRPVSLDLSALEGAIWSATAARDLVAAEIADFDPLDDLHASAAYRSRVAVTLGLRVLERAVIDAKGEPV
ncbi:FAD binding domain-containing protein [Roseovarius sp. CH_XMU1461]|uniref:FAD binding domain-containing protein n=1 Tax=Roseovarius sp. CH_XMU1461 TaxID=3107777 RepID=UPI003009D31F